MQRATFMRTVLAACAALAFAGSAAAQAARTVRMNLARCMGISCRVRVRVRVRRS